MNKVIVRSLTGIAYIALIVGGLLLQAPALWVLTVVLCVPAVMEFQNLTGTDRASDGVRIVDVTGATLLASVAAASASAPMAGSLTLLLVIFYLILRPVMALYNRDMRAAVHSYVGAMASLVYVALPLLMLGWIATRFSAWIALAMFIMIWLNDTGAFCVGSLMGRRRLWERLSPKKSWEGFFGGLVFSAGFGVAAPTLLGADCLCGLGMVEMGVLGVLVTIASTYGDLLESMLKRAAGVKDSGRLLPGHGGMLDRIDSLLLAAPVTFLFLSLIA